MNVLETTAGKTLVLCVLLLGLSIQGSAQILLMEEVQRIEETVTISKLSPGDRQEAFIRLAKLLQLSGNLEDAAKAWKNAALADPQNQHDTALVEGAFCLVGLGEMDQAETQVKPFLQSKHPGTRIKARYLNAHIQAFRSGELAPLRALVDDPDYERYMPGIYYTLWKVSDIELYQSKLLSTYPQSPEALILKQEASSNRLVSAQPSVLWLLFPGRDQVRFEPLVPGTGDGGTQQEAPWLQTGLFSKEENAQAMATELKSLGFEAVVVPRRVNGTSFWAVTVPSGPDLQKTKVQLEEKGFEAFSVF
ncbi:MAG: SPOR domain-containing protein [Treponema sp.]|jgi:tetratricopeptide (TPR) repeat protein|nr:SPOR domain-containing protein [Treponema sp.]